MARGYHPYGFDGGYHPYGDSFNRNEFNRNVVKHTTLIKT